MLLGGTRLHVETFENISETIGTITPLRSVFNSLVRLGCRTHPATMRETGTSKYFDKLPPSSND